MDKRMSYLPVNTMPQETYITPLVSRVEPRPASARYPIRRNTFLCIKATA